MAELKEASSVVTSENATTFYAERLGLSESVEPTEAEEKSTEPAQEPEQVELEAEEEAKEQKPEKQKDKLNKRFDKVTQRAKDAEAKAVELENRLKEYEARVNPQSEPAKVQAEGKPQASQFNDAFEYAEALAEWSAENALKQRDAQEASRKAEEAQKKMMQSWNEKIAKAKADLPDFDAMVQSSTIVVGDEIRDSILESDVGPQLLYFLASDEDFAKQLTEMPVVKALREIGKLEAKFEAKEEKPRKAEKQKEAVSRSTAPSPIKPLSGGKVGNDVLMDSNGEFHGTYSQWKAARQSGKVR